MKFFFFLFITVLFFGTVYLNFFDKDWISVAILSFMYVLFILISLYELGRIELEKEENENRNNRK